MRLSRQRSLIAALLLPAVLFRGLIPAGFMPAIDGEGSLSMEFCHGMGHSKPASTENPHDAGLQCPFAATASPAPPPAMATQAVACHASFPPDEFPVLRETVPSIVRSQSPRAPPVHG
jgi:hypothetical protein